MPTTPTAPDPGAIAPPPDPGPWKARSIFVSSTFRDMQRERDWLTARVFPRLREELARRRHHLEPIDLRLGIETGRTGTEEDRELLVLKVCLDEIERSRPFLLVLLGDRYGWVPPAERIEAAAREQGFATAPAGKSVTALEIEFGLLEKDPGRKRRSLILLRRPLPCDRMPESIRADFSDAHSSDPLLRAGQARLEALKDRLRRDPRLDGRVHEYSAGWDERTNQVTGLEAFGELVFQELWAALDEDTRGSASRPPPTWEEQERTALAEFVEHRSRGFVGRAEILARLAAFARSPAPPDAPPAGPLQAACVTGSPGSGKSALFARLHRDLSADGSLLLLASAAGATARGGSVDSVLRRFIQELATSLGTAVSLPEEPSSDDLDAAFLSLLHRASARRRVVVLLDALDQLEPTPRGQHLTWLQARHWPANARLIATSLPGTPADALGQAAGITPLDLPQLTAADAAEIGRQVWARHHRTLAPEVLDALAGKTLPDGTLACGNPLWLTLALEQLDLLDADDFARAEREFAGSATERMTALLLDTARRMPADVAGLYGWLLEQNERIFGPAQARGFAAAVALSRTGWRESDLLDLVPGLGKVLFPGQDVAGVDDLALASLRRGFRAHVVRRGENGLLDFFHAQMRRAVLERCAPDQDSRRRLHTAIVDHLESLPPSDPLQRLERMPQLLGQHDALRAARYFASLDPLEVIHLVDRLGPSWTLVDWIAAGEPTGDAAANANLLWLLGWLDDAALPPAELHRLTAYLMQGLLPGLGQASVIETRRAFLEACCRCLTGLVAADPADAARRHDLSAALGSLGDVLREQGHLSTALDAFRRSLAIRERLAGEDPSSGLQQRELSICLDKLADALVRQGQLPAAREAFGESLSIRERLAQADPSSAGRQRELAGALDRWCELTRIMGDLPAALQAARRSLALVERLAELGPTDPGRQRDLAVSLGKLAATLVAGGDRPAALDASRRSLAIRRRLAEADPASVVAQTDLSLGLERMGELLIHQGDLPGALESLRASLALSERLARADPGNAGRQRTVAAGLENLADVLQRLRDLPAALQAQRDSVAIHGRLVALDPTNAQWQRNLGQGFFRLGDLLHDRGDLPGAREAYREALEVRRRSGGSEPVDLAGQRSLALLHNRLGLVARTLGDQAETVSQLRACLEVIEDMRRRGMPLDPPLDRIHQGLVEAFSRLDRPR